MTMHRRRSQGGFTLIELLATIAILGTLSGVTVVGVGAVQEQALRSACASDADTIATAEEAALVAGGYLSEADLVERRLLASESTRHDVVLSDGTYEIVAVGECATIDGEVAMDVPPGDDAARREAEDPEQRGEDDRRRLEEAERASRLEDDRRRLEEAERDGCRDGQIDINEADVEELLRIKHIGKVRARLIVAQRPFKSVEQLTEVRGIKDKNLKDILDEGLVCVG